MQNCCASHLVVNFRNIFYVKLCVQLRTFFLFPSSSLSMKGAIVLKMEKGCFVHPTGSCFFGDAGMLPRDIIH